MADKKFPDWEKIINDEVLKIESGYHVVREMSTEVVRPSMYLVCLINDDYTPMDFVVYVLEKVFHKSHEVSTSLMLKIHTEGDAVCGLFTREVAETKVTQVIDMAHTYEYPLKCIMCKDQEYVIKKP